MGKFGGPFKMTCQVYDQLCEAKNQGHARFEETDGYDPSQAQPR